MKLSFILFAIYLIVDFFSTIPIQKKNTDTMPDALYSHISSITIALKMPQSFPFLFL